MDNFSGLSIADLPSPLAEAIATVPPGLGKRQRTRRQLLLAAVRVFAVRGIANATIQEIAQQAEMTPGTVYNHFESREAIVDAVAAWFTGTMCESIQQSQRNVARGAQRMAIGQRRYAWFARESPRWAGVMQDVAAHAPELDAQVAGYARGHFAGLRDAFVQRAQGGSGRRQEGVASRREVHAARVAHEQCAAELVLQPRNRLAQCRLGDVQALGGAVDVQLFSHGDELAKQAGLDHGGFLAPVRYLGRIVLPRR